MQLDKPKQKLHVEFRKDVSRTFDVVAYNPEAPTINVRRIRRVKETTVFNLPGMKGMSFVSELPYHNSRCGVSNWSMIELRPWLRDGRCMYGERQGTFGHYFTQSSMMAAPLT